jgi:hypothetical protein
MAELVFSLAIDTLKKQEGVNFKSPLGKYYKKHAATMLEEVKELNKKFMTFEQLTSLMSAQVVSEFNKEISCSFLGIKETLDKSK